MFSCRFLVLCSLGAAWLLAACERAPHANEKAESKPASGQIVVATWYDVPAESLARRRAGESELTAASDHYKLGTLVRVTGVASGRSVVVRITDTGLRRSKSRIDVCREAAEQLGIVSEGMAKVRLDALPPETDVRASVTPGS